MTLLLLGGLGWFLYKYGPEAIANYNTTGKFIVHGGEVPGVPLVQLKGLELLG